MKLETSERAEKALVTLMEAFEEPENLPEKLAKTYLVSNRYCSRWSPRNQLLVWLHRSEDAATYKTWLKRGRRVRKGEQAFGILKPIMKKFMREEEIELDDGTIDIQRVQITYLAGFEAWPVFGIEQTDIEDSEKWERFEPADSTEFLDSLPWLALADKWKLSVEAVPSVGALGFYDHGQRIGMCVADMQTWAHEMIHAAEDRLNNLTKALGQQPDNELVAELGSAVLLNLAGMSDKVDMRYTYEYVNGYDGDFRKTAFLLLGRICKAVELILAEAAE